MRCHFDSALDNELIDDHLRAVGEVAELRFPDHQTAWVGARHAVLEAEHRGFARACCSTTSISAWPCTQVVERNVFGAVVGVVEDRVAVAERAAPGVLAGEPDRRAFAAAGSHRRASPHGPSRCPRRCGPSGSAARGASAHAGVARSRRAIGAAIRRPRGARRPATAVSGAPVGAGPAEALPHPAEREHLLARHEIARVAQCILERTLDLAAHLGHAGAADHAFALRGALRSA